MSDEESEYQYCPSCGYPAHAGHASDCEVSKPAQVEQKTLGGRDLKEMIGSDWKDRAFSDLVDEDRLAMSAEFDQLELEKEINPDQLDNFKGFKLVLEANAPNASVRLAKVGQEVVVVAKSEFEGSVFYAFAKPSSGVASHIEMTPGAHGVKEKSVGMLAPYKVGIFDSASNRNFALDRMIDISGKKNTVAFFEVEGKRHNYNVQLTAGYEENIELDTMTNFPSSAEELEIFLHEVGHLIRNGSEPSQEYHERKKDAYDIAKGEKQAVGQEMADARQILINEERGAHAIAFAVLRELKNRGFGCATQSNIEKVQTLSEYFLSTYDQNPFTPADRLTKKHIPPQFSGSMRGEARKLSAFLRKRSLNADALPNYDPDSGESIGNNPKRQREILKEKFPEDQSS